MTRVAVVGAGPAGFYATDKLLKAGGIQVELFDRLPTPWGLVRAGVAPDHPKIKSVTRVFEKTAKLEGFRFHGNVEVGSDITHEELLAHHDAVIYTYGASLDRRLGIPGEELPGSVPATEFVAWYNGHPDAVHHEFDLRGPRAVVIGNGNVALDVARMLVLTGEELGGHRHGGRGDRGARRQRGGGGRRARPPRPRPGRVHDAGAARARRARRRGRRRRSRRRASSIRSAPPGWRARTPTARPATTSRSSARTPPASRTGTASGSSCASCASPVEILGEERVEGVRIVHNELLADEHGHLRAHHTDVEETIDCTLVLRSVGYRGAGIEGLPFDERSGTIVNDGGRVLEAPGGAPLAGVYTAGWIKRGPSGVIGTNKKCAHETVDRLLEDLQAGRLPAPEHSAAELDTLLDARGATRVDYASWERIDEHERAAGEAQGRPRVKLTRREHLIEKARGDG